MEVPKEHKPNFDKLKNKLNSFASKAKAIVQHGRGIAQDSSKLFLFKGMFLELKPYFKEFTSTYEALSDLCLNIGIPDLFPTAQDIELAKKTEALYYEGLAIYEEYMNPTPSRRVCAGSSSANNTTDNSTLNQSKTIRARLPEIRLPTFSGSYTDWPLFRDTYTSLIHNEVTLSEIEKFHFLLSCLSGTALSLIKGIALTEANYAQAWQVLKDNYDDKRRLANSYLKTVVNFTPFRSKPTAASLKFFITNIVEAVASYNNLEIPDSDEFILQFLILRCLDPQTKKEFEKRHAAEEFPSYDSLVDFLRAELRSLELTADDFPTSSSKKPQETMAKSQVVNSSPSGFRSSLFTENDSSHPSEDSSHGKLRKKNQVISCPVCHEPHLLYNCKQFKGLSPQQRINALRKWHGCTNCLSHRHHKNQCPSKNTCQSCHLKHHSWLHMDSRSPQDSVPVSTPASTKSAQEAVTLSGTSNSVQVILGTAMVNILDCHGRPQPLRLVVDCGSQHSFITSRCAQSLGLRSSEAAPNISGIGQVHLPRAQGQLTCTLHSRFGKHQLKTSAVIVPEITGHLPQTTIPYEYHSLLGAYNLADPTYWRPQAVDFLLGADLYSDIITGGPIDIRAGFPKLIPSTLGHIVMGRCSHGTHQSTSTSLFVKSSCDIQDVMSKFWELEEVPKEVPWSEEEKACERHFQSSHYRLPSGRFVVALPFKSSIDELACPKQLVEKRFRKLEYRLDQNLKLKAEYHAFMDEYLSLGHMSPATIPGRYIIPHHCVTKLEGENSKLRVVFDASCKGPQGSLNCHLMAGPKLQNDICDIVLNFRTKKVVLVADIVKMYRQVLVRPEDRVYQHIFWRKNPMEPVQQFQLNTVTYGVAPSAFLAIRALQQLAKENAQEFPLASEVLLQDVYVDDIVSGADSLDEARFLMEQLIQLLQRGCFELSKWKSNVPSLLNQVLDETQNSSFPINPQADCMGHKILGLQWVPQTDVFSFKIQAPVAPLTKRGILSSIARIYDPLGYLSPVVFQAKYILQQVWKAQCDWDEEVPPSIKHKWQIFSECLPKLSDVKILRYTNINEGSNFLLGFADASQIGYAATVYLHVRTSQGQSTYLLRSRTKLAPTKLSTIPRLELCAALLLSRLLNSCRHYISKICPTRILLFTDSTVVLGWLKTPVNQLKAFVAHRVLEILETTQVSSWHHVESSSNPADCASRGLMPHELPGHSLWWSGPSWLADSPDHWPIDHQSDIRSELLPELKEQASASLLVSQTPTILDWIETKSSYLKILRVLCHVIRFTQVARKRPAATGAVTVPELEHVKFLCIRLIQQKYLPDPKAMRSIQPWKSLSPVLDSRGIFRVGGRLQHAEISFDAKHPILLPKCHFTRILIRYYHQAFLHIGPSSLQAMLQGRFYISSGRKLIRSCVRTCATCQRTSPKVQPPSMGSIPKCRLQEGQVFQNVGVDLGGPFLIKESKRRKAALGKCYLCLFVCMVTRAIHLEVISDCSTDAFLAAFNRFISRRGKPLHVFSDCGTNFIGAAADLKELKVWYQKDDTRNQISLFSSERDIQWHFIPPRSPHFGGLWEAGIKSAKSLLSKNLASTPLTFEELYTLFCRIEAILNSRPLCPLSDDSEVLDCLTPAHFLIGRPLIAPPESSLLDVKENSLDRWQLIQQRAQHFWSHWRLEYLNQLQQRRKWTSPNVNLQVGDLVIVKDAAAPPAVWPLARVLSVHPGQDGVVRVATIRTPTGVYKRPAIKLVPLRLHKNDNDL